MWMSDVRLGSSGPRTGVSVNRSGATSTRKGRRGRMRLTPPRRHPAVAACLGQSFAERGSFASTPTSLLQSRRLCTSAICVNACHGALPPPLSRAGSTTLGQAGAISPSPAARARSRGPAFRHTHKANRCSRARKHRGTPSWANFGRHRPAWWSDPIFWPLPTPACIWLSSSLLRPKSAQSWPNRTAKRATPTHKSKPTRCWWHPAQFWLPRSTS